MKHNIVCLSFLLAVFVGGSTSAGDKADARGAERLAKVEADYDATGVLKYCVSLRALRHSRVIDEQTIFFEGRGSKGYINRLPRRCPNLVREDRFSYTSRTGQLCKSDIITIFDNFGTSYNSCSLGKFEEMKEKPKAEKGSK